MAGTQMMMVGEQSAAGGEMLRQDRGRAVGMQQKKFGQWLLKLEPWEGWTFGSFK